MAKDLGFENGALESGNSVVVTPSDRVQDLVTEEVAMKVGSVLEIVGWHGAGKNPDFTDFDREYARENNCQP